MNRAIITALAVTAMVGGNAPGFRTGGPWQCCRRRVIGSGVGAIVGSALTPREVYVVPPPPPPTYYSPAGYGPPP